MVGVTTQPCDTDIAKLRALATRTLNEHQDDRGICAVCGCAPVAGPANHQRAPWRTALAAVPRHEFIPDTMWIDNNDEGPALVPLHRDDDPDRWLELAYSDDAVITQIDDGHPAGPGLAGMMLAALDAKLGHRVCEIGTGTGHNAALLARRLGAEHVTSIEVDAAHRWWGEQGKPDVEQWRFTVNPKGQQLDLSSCVW